MIPVFVPTVDSRADYRSVLTDRLGHLVFLLDEERRGILWNFQRALRQGIALCSAIHEPAFAVVQDDVYPCNDFPHHLARAVAMQPGRIFSLFAPYTGDWRRPRKAYHNIQQAAFKEGYCWAYIAFSGGQGFVWTPEHAQAFLTWFDSGVQDDPVFWGENVERPRRNRDDWCVYQYHRMVLKSRILVTVPSLVEHLGRDSTLPGVDHTLCCAQHYELDLRREWTGEVYGNP